MIRRSLMDYAKEFVGDRESWESRGYCMLQFGIKEGLQQHHKVLEVGCGCLSFGMPVMDYLNTEGYTGLEPAGWLVEAALRDHPGAADLVNSKQPRFIYRDDFDAQESPWKFDFVFAHSVVSHAANWQYPLLLANLRRVMNPGAKFLFSYRQDSSDSDSPNWAYPGNTFYSARTIRATARRQGFRIYFKRGYKAIMTRQAPRDFHDWAVAVRVPKRWQEFVPYSDDDLRIRFSVDSRFDRRMLLGEGVGRMVERND